MNYWLIIPVSLHPNTLCSVEMMELSAPPQTLVITCADSSVFVMVRTPDWFKNLRGRAEVTIASFSSRLQGFHHSYPNRKGFSNHANRQVGMESSRQAELAASGSFHDLLPRLALPATNYSSLELATTGKTHLLELALKRLLTRMVYPGSLAAICRQRSPSQPEQAYELPLWWCWSGWFVADG